ncbi:MAG: hypothetical protein ACRC1J_08015, partial [Sandaracinobacteroides sp.]
MVSEMFIVNSAVGLLDRGHEVDIFCMWGTGWPDVLSSAGKAHGLLERCHVSKYAEASWLARLVSAPFVALSVVRHQG